MTCLHLALLTLVLALPGLSLAAPLSIAGFTFADGEQAFADDAFIVSGQVTGTTEEQVRQTLVGADFTDTIRVITPDVAIIELVFTDNLIVNGPGTDLVIFEASGALGAGTADPRERFEVTIFNGSFFPPFVSFDPVDTGFDRPPPGGNLNLFVVEVDLSDFGLPPGSTTNRVRIRLVDNLSTRSADPTALGALNSVPVMDSDGDGLSDVVDNCPDDFNPDQKDQDANGVGDACNDAEDVDGDDYADSLDNCPNDFNPGQEDADEDGLGDLCDPFPNDPENDLAQCSLDLGDCQADLIQCENDSAQCLSDFGECEAARSQCETGLLQSETARNQCESDLLQTLDSLGICTSSLATAQSEAAQCANDLGTAQSSLAICNQEFAQCSNDLTAARAALIQSQTDLFDCTRELGAAQSFLFLCNLERARLQGLLDQAQASIEQLESDLAESQAELNQALAALALATADTDADGVRDTSDACPGTTPGDETDALGCSIAQFCGSFDPSSNVGRQSCKKADWQNDEPARASPKDCTARREPGGVLLCAPA